MILNEAYERSGDMAGDLAVELIIALKHHPKQRLGQIIANAVYPDVDLFNITDEDLLESLKQFNNKSEH